MCFSTLHTAHVLIAERPRSLFSLTPSLHPYLYFMKEVDAIMKSASNHLHPHLFALMIRPLNTTAQQGLIAKWRQINSTEYEPWICTFVCSAWGKAHVCGRVCTYSIFISFKSSLTLSCRGNAGEDGGWKGRCLHTWTLLVSALINLFYFILCFLSYVNHSGRN